jgi:predicted nucleic acid-binding protein
MNCMKGKYFVDTSILVYAHDRSAGAKHNNARRLVEDLWHSGAGVVSTQVLHELCVNLRRRATHPLSSDDTRQVIQDYMGWKVIVNGPEAILEALQMEARYKISFWDALILHAAETAGVDAMYSEDFSSGRSYGSVRVVNPFSAMQ